MGRWHEAGINYWQIKQIHCFLSLQKVNKSKGNLQHFQVLSHSLRLLLRNYSWYPLSSWITPFSPISPTNFSNTTPARKATVRLKMLVFSDRFLLSMCRAKGKQRRQDPTLEIRKVRSSKNKLPEREEKWESAKGMNKRDKGRRGEFILHKQNLCWPIRPWHKH